MPALLFMTLKRFVLILLTLVVIGRMLLSLGSSLSQPQIQARLELYQANLSLQVTTLETQNQEFSIESLLGETPYADAEQKYQETLELAKSRRETIRAQLQSLSANELTPSGVSFAQVPDLSPEQQELRDSLEQVNQFIATLKLKTGILEAKQGKIDDAIAIWQAVQQEFRGESQNISQVANILEGLWQNPPQIANNAETEIKQELDGWFEYQALTRLYEQQNNETALASIQAAQQEKAEKAFFQLAIVSLIPLIGGLIGFGLLLFLLVQWFLKKEQAILATNQNTAWETPWNWEITWQVLVVGFFFFGQIFLPLLIASLGLNPTGLGIRGKAFYVLATYILMTAGGLTVLYFSIRNYFPLPQDWFRFKGNRWFIWGIGGYLVAIPLVLLISIINQQIWQGQGGSNPLLSLALQAQDSVALLIFFTTAAILAPIFEEIIFRGFLLPSLTRYFPVWGAIALSSLLFSIAHLSLSEVLPLAVLGIVLGVVYTRSRNLLAPIVVHSLWNTGTLLSLYILGGSVE